MAQLFLLYEQLSGVNAFAVSKPRLIRELLESMVETYIKAGKLEVLSEEQAEILLQPERQAKAMDNMLMLDTDLSSAKTAADRAVEKSLEFIETDEEEITVNASLDAFGKEK